VGNTWTDQPIHFIDFEGSRASGVLEYGVVTLRGGRVMEARTRLCQATGRVDAQDTAVHGLRAEALAPANQRPPARLAVAALPAPAQHLKHQPCNGQQKPNFLVAATRAFPLR